MTSGPTGRGPVCRWHLPNGPQGNDGWNRLLTRGWELWPLGDIQQAYFHFHQQDKVCIAAHNTHTHTVSLQFGLVSGRNDSQWDAWWHVTLNPTVNLKLLNCCTHSHFVPISSSVELKSTGWYCMGCCRGTSITAICLMNLGAQAHSGTVLHSWCPKNGPVQCHASGSNS